MRDSGADLERRTQVVGKIFNPPQRPDVAAPFLRLSQPAKIKTRLAGGFGLTDAQISSGARLHGQVKRQLVVEIFSAHARRTIERSRTGRAAIQRGRFMAHPVLGMGVRLFIFTTAEIALASRSQLALSRSSCFRPGRVSS